MPRIRTIKPEFCTSEQVAECSRDARLLFVLMWCFCDDAGRHKASVRKLKMECFPGDALGDAEVTRLIDELIENDLIEEYEVGSERYWQVLGWNHQKIDQPIVKHPDSDGKVEQFSRRLGGKQRQLLRIRLVEKYGEKCMNCGSTTNLAIDHIVPRCKGGSNEFENLQLLCKPCNNEKYISVRDGDALVTHPRKGMEGNGKEGKGEEGIDCGVGEESPTPPQKPQLTDFDFVLSDGSEWFLSLAKHDEYRKTFPELDLGREFRKASQWLRDNPKKRKTPKGMPAFLGSWLSRAQNSGAAALSYGPGRKRVGIDMTNPEWIKEFTG